MRLTPKRRCSSGYALLMILGVTGVTLIVLAATMNRTTTVAKLNERNNQYIVNLNAAEAATEKVFALMAYDFQAYGPGYVKNRLDFYRGSIPKTNESPYWGNFEFSNAKSVVDQTYVSLLITNYTGPLPSQYEGLIAVGSPIYRIVSNVRSKTSGSIRMTNAIQEDIMLALVPITTYAIFYNGLLEFSTCATMEVRGRVHANSNIYVGAGNNSSSSSTLKFYNAVTASGTVTAPYNASHSWDTPTVYNSDNWNTWFYDSFAEHVSTVTLAINMTNTRALIEMPPSSVLPTNSSEQARMYNQARMILLVSNATANVSNSTVFLKLQTPPSVTQVAGEDGSSFKTNYNFASAMTNLPFLTLTNRFYDQREDKTNIVTQIDIGKFNQWVTATSNAVPQTKFSSASGHFPTVLYVGDFRTNNSRQLPSMRVANGRTIVTNGGLGFTVATPNPLYVWGNYNAPTLATTNTSNVLPAALMSDAITILSTNWSDTTSYILNPNGPNAAIHTTVNAAILTGIVASTGTSDTTFSGGVHNLPRLLEDWTGDDLWLNTSIVNLFTSAKATNKFVYPGASSYYDPPTRKFSFDSNFLDPNKQPPGVPSALVPIRHNWASPPPNTVTYNVTP